ncbi:MAG: S1 RNA-binding domain-containing protein [Patescibacteria group bacterium]|nr:S1 RNA-binding domain-containing protein [Patescibacteria group bacterium]
MNTFDDLLKSSDVRQVPKAGDLVEGKVVSIARGEVYLDVDGIFTGLVRGRELADESDRFSDLKVGDSVIATVVEAENEKGVMELSFRSAGHQKAWQELNDFRAKGEVVEVKVLDVNKGGLLVQLNNVNGFLPVSQLSAENYPRVEGGNKNKILEKLRGFVGKKIKVKVIDANEKDDKLIVSEKDVFAEARKELIGQFSVGDIVEGTITSLVDFGAFLEFFKPENPDNKLEGLVHISELAWQRIDHPKSIFKVGDKVKAQIISVENDRISLSIKRLTEDPWKKAAEKYHLGDKVQGKVVKTDKFGAFVELDADVQGLAHISELSDNQIENAEEVVKVGETYEFTIVSLEPAEHRLGLSLKSEKPKPEIAEEKVESPQFIPSDSAPQSGEAEGSHDQNKEK